MIIRSVPAVLVDSSVWIEFYRPSGRLEVQEATAEALAHARVLTLPIIVAEVVQGAPDAETLEELAADFSALEWISEDAGIALSAARLGFALRQRGRAVPPTDLLIAAGAIQADAELWHMDRHFEVIAEIGPLRQRRF
jgi:predicted nucleic acid-binding protein